MTDFLAMITRAPRSHPLFTESLINYESTEKLRIPELILMNHHKSRDQLTKHADDLVADYMN